MGPLPLSFQIFFIVGPDFHLDFLDSPPSQSGWHFPPLVLLFTLSSASTSSPRVWLFCCTLPAKMEMMVVTQWLHSLPLPEHGSVSQKRLMEWPSSSQPGLHIGITCSTLKMIKCLPSHSWSDLIRPGWDPGEKKVKVLVPQSCPILCDPMNSSPSGSSVHGILQNTGVG